MKIILVAGARPNFMKLAALSRAFIAENIDYVLVHTGQHYDENMSEVFFKDFGLKKPDWNLSVGAGNHADQTAEIMQKFNEVCDVEKPDIVIVIGDINSTMACALVVSKLNNVYLAHIEAGERSFDKRMPEEINRLVTDVVSDYLFCATVRARQNLLSEGINESKIFLVGNVMIDNLIYYLPKIDQQKVNDHVLVTIHRSSNTDNKDNLEIILSALCEICKKTSVIFPLHPRTRKKIKEFGLYFYLKDILVVDPYNYFEFIKTMIESSLIITDSGGIQVEATTLDIPCITVRENTEWEFTLTEGTNILVGVNKDKIIKETFKVLGGNRKHKNLTAENYMLLDGNSSNRIINILRERIVKYDR